MFHAKYAVITVLVNTTVYTLVMDVLDSLKDQFEEIVNTIVKQNQKVYVLLIKPIVINVELVV